MRLDFWKYEGAGNDFIMIDGRNSPDGEPTVELPADTIRRLCDRHYGIGADGLVIMRSDADTDFRMRYYNADGGEVNMCGNGGRCLVLFARHLGVISREAVFAGRDGEHRARIVDDNGEKAVVELAMADVSGYEYRDNAFILNTGVPHYVGFVDDLDNLNVEEEGTKIRFDERMGTEGINVNFVKVMGPGQLAVRTYERGVEHETLACGTGATAAAIATHLLSQNDTGEFTVKVQGGRLEVRFEKDDDQKFVNIKLTGPARRVFSGSIDTGNLPLR